MIANADRTTATSDTQQRGGALRPALWVLVALCVAGNVAAQVMGLSLFVSMGFGVVAVAGASWLIVDRYRRRQR